MVKRLNSGSSQTKENKYKMHSAKLESKRRKQESSRIQRKQDWDNNPEWQKKKKIMRLAKIERKRKKREHGGRSGGL